MRCTLLLAAATAPSFSTRNAWESPPVSTYYTEAELPGDPSKCCGSQLIGDPSHGVASQICECDLTGGECDAACCCDQDCSEYETMTVFACSSNKTYSARAGVKMCSEDLDRVNLPQSATAAGWETETDLDGILCVVHDNSASLGGFYRDPTASSALSAEEVGTELKRYGVRAYDDCVVGTDAYCEQGASGIVYTGTEDHYSYAQPVLGDGCLSAGSPAGCDAKRQALLPAAAPDGRCGGRQQRLGFLVDVPPFSCQLDLLPSTLPQLCATSLNASFLQQQLLSPTPAAAAALKPELYLRRGDRYAPLPNFTAITAPPASVYDAATETCSNALVGLEYALFFTGKTGTLASVSAYLSLTSLSLQGGPGTGLQTTSTGAISVISLQYAANFLDANNVNKGRGLSGKPGYLRGFPVLVADGSDPFNLRRQGLSMLSIGSKGECVQEGEGTSTTLLFGEELAASCATSLSYEQLPAFCDLTVRPQDLPHLEALQLDWTSSGPVMHMGAFGDAHPADSADWVGVTLQLPSTGLTMSYTEGSCSNVLAGIHVQLLVADVGALVMPVRKIIGAQIVLTSQTVVARRCALGVPCDTRIVTRATSEVVTVPADGRTFDYVPPMPTLIPDLPAEIFYPFTGFGLSSAAPPSRGEIAPLALLASLATCALLLTSTRRR